MHVMCVYVCVVKHLHGFGVRLQTLFYPSPAVITTTITHASVCGPLNEGGLGSVMMNIAVIHCYIR